MPLNNNAGHVHPQGDVTSLVTALAGKAPIPVSPITFTINGSAPAAGVSVPAALGAPTLALLSEVITYSATLQARVDLQAGLLRKLMDVLTTAGMVLEA